MMLCIGDVFDQAEAAALRFEVERLRFADGRETAGWAARLVKNNEQADADDDQLESLRSRIAERIFAKRNIPTGGAAQGADAIDDQPLQAGKAVWHPCR